MKILRIMGSGMKGLSHLTLESIDQLRLTKKILWLGTTAHIDEFVLHHSLNSEEITHLYQNGALDSDNYRAIKTKVFDELNLHHDVALVVLGHPRLGVTIVQEFQSESKNQHFQLEVLPGISSFDTMINDLELDPIEEGTCLVDANRLILYDYHMDPCLNYFVYHICSIGNSKTDYESPTENNAVHFLKNKLNKHFPLNHSIYIIKSSISKNKHSVHYKNTIAHLEDLLKEVSFDATLFIPALLPQAKNVNIKFYEYLTESKIFN